MAAALMLLLAAGLFPAGAAYAADGEAAFEEMPLAEGENDEALRVSVIYPEQTDQAEFEQAMALIAGELPQNEAVETVDLAEFEKAMDILGQYADRSSLLETQLNGALSPMGLPNGEDIYGTAYNEMGEEIKQYMIDLVAEENREKPNNSALSFGRNQSLVGHIVYWDSTDPDHMVKLYECYLTDPGGQGNVRLRLKNDIRLDPGNRRSLVRKRRLYLRSTVGTGHTTDIWMDSP